MTSSRSKKPLVSVVMPVYNGETTLLKTLKSLLSQSAEFQELIIVDDASSDRSVDVIKGFLEGKREYKLIESKEHLGLAGSYNKGIRISKGELIVTLHQDIVLRNDSLKELIKPFSNGQIVAAGHIVKHPLEVWKKYNFWQKCLFARLAGRNFSGIDGKFDCFRRNALEKAGLFDEFHFRTAGEDGDIVFKLKKNGRVVNTKAEIIHLHKIDPNFNWRDVIYKQKQYSEAQGVLLARGVILGIYSLTKSFFREILLVGLIIPYVRILVVILIFFYSFYYTKRVYLEEYRDKRIFILPFFNIFLLFVSFVYSLKGFIYGKQKV